MGEKQSCPLLQMLSWPPFFRSRLCLKKWPPAAGREGEGSEQEQGAVSGEELAAQTRIIPIRL